VTTAPHTHTHVDVLLTACDQQDAEAVFDALRTLFDATSTPRPAASPAPGGPAQATSGHPIVWSLCVNTRKHGEAPGPVELKGPVTADLSGGPHYVHDVAEALAGAFEVEKQGSVSGDQEVDVRLLVKPRARTTR
jgi:hypothetical protein